MSQSGSHPFSSIFNFLHNSGPNNNRTIYKTNIILYNFRETNIDGTCARGVTEPIIQTHSTGRKLVATTSTSTAVTKSHIIRGRETVSVRSVKTTIVSSVVRLVMGSPIKVRLASVVAIHSRILSLVTCRLSLLEPRQTSGDENSCIGFVFMPFA
ncbi:hypothetical protein LENED_005256 [Lentinula edodes]|uniref:Uncharacterized protein n=1 Tax=Lentinula edodes TaxID=5353 RepID=A0A1Q3E8M3_LENED|nr:hypothetical protein LENED_005256 [Lentinula edodes]